MAVCLQRAARQIGAQLLNAHAQALRAGGQAQAGLKLLQRQAARVPRAGARVGEAGLHVPSGGAGFVGVGFIGVVLGGIGGVDAHLAGQARLRRSGPEGGQVQPGKAGLRLGHGLGGPGRDARGQIGARRLRAVFRIALRIVLCFALRIAGCAALCMRRRRGVRQGIGGFFIAMQQALAQCVDVALLRRVQRVFVSGMLLAQAGRKAHVAHGAAQVGAQQQAGRGIGGRGVSGGGRFSGRRALRQRLLQGLQAEFAAQRNVQARAGVVAQARAGAVAAAHQAGAVQPQQVHELVEVVAARNIGDAQAGLGQLHGPGVKGVHLHAQRQLQRRGRPGGGRFVAGRPGVVHADAGRAQLVQAQLAAQQGKQMPARLGFVRLHGQAALAPAHFRGLAAVQHGALQPFDLQGGRHVGLRPGERLLQRAGRSRPAPQHDERQQRGHKQRQQQPGQAARPAAPGALGARGRGGRRFGQGAGG